METVTESSSSRYARDTGFFINQTWTRCLSYVSWDNGTIQCLQIRLQCSHSSIALLDCLLVKQKKTSTSQCLPAYVIKIWKFFLHQWCRECRGRILVYIQHWNQEVMELPISSVGRSVLTVSLARKYTQKHGQLDGPLRHNDVVKSRRMFNNQRFSFESFYDVMQRIGRLPQMKYRA